LEISCDYSNNGCEKYIKLAELKNHVDNCNFNPNLHILCDCGQNIETIKLTDHQNNCIDYLKEQLNASLDMISSLNKSKHQLMNELKEAREEITITNEWRKVEEFEEISSDMPKKMKELLLNSLTSTLNEDIFDYSSLSEKFRSDFGGNWTVIVGNNMKQSISYCKNYLFLKIGKIDVLIISTVKPVHDFLILKKLTKIIDEGIRKKAWTEDMENVWGLFWSLTDDSLNMSERLLEKNIVEYFLKYYALFPDKLCSSMIGTFANISEFTDLRKQLMRPELLSIILSQFSNEKQQISYLCCYFFANVLSEGKNFWDQNLRSRSELNRNTIIAKLKFNISEWDKISEQMSLYFITFKPLNRLLIFNDKIPQEIHYFAVWTLAHFTRTDSANYSHLIEEDNCVRVLDDLIKNKKTEEHVRNLAKSVLSYVQKNNSALIKSWKIA
jgi:hypothetical protein